jgi:catechol 2,3-dioxygenase-like lactoylglutathione lyase family enzyme
MIHVRKIAHASYEMPDLDKQVEYYTNILGLTLAAREKDAVYLPTRSNIMPWCCVEVPR